MGWFDYTCTMFHLRPHIVNYYKLFFILLAALGLFSQPADATPEFARQTGFECQTCHIDAIGGGPLTETGRNFLADLKSKGLYKPLTTAQHIIRLIIGYFHLTAAILWFGTIMYVHVLLKPAYASKGLPKGELRLGWISMIVLLITGTLLTIARIPTLAAFTTTRFGVLLSFKIILFLVMLASAVVVTLYIGPRLRKQKSFAPSMENGTCTIDGLCGFDGKEGRPAYIAYKGIVYDMTKSRLWKNGSHVMKHAAGNDLTDILKTAPHGEDKVIAMPQIGRLLMPNEKIKQPFHMRLFYFFAYMNLVLVFVITFIIALWRWW